MDDINNNSTSDQSLELQKLQEEVAQLKIENDHLRSRLANHADDNELHGGEHLLQEIIDAPDDMIFAKDINFIYKAGNRAFENFIGRPLHEIIGHTDEEWFPDQKTVDYFRDWDKKLLSTGEKQSFEEWVDYPDGKRVLLHTIKHPIYQGEAIIGLIGISRDITEFHQKNTALVEKELYQQALLDNFPFLVWLKDTESRFLAVNKPFAQAAGASNTDELIGKNDLDIWPRDLANIYRLDDEEVMESGCKKNVEEEVAEQGIRKWVETFKAPVLDTNRQLLGTVGFARDITERKQAEEIIQEHNSILEKQVRERTQELESAKRKAEQANVEKSRFLANMSHELRTPMHAINSFTNLALKREKDEKNRHFMENIETSTRRLTNLLNDLLDLSKLEAGKMCINTESCNLADIANESIAQLEGLIQTKNLNVESEKVQSAIGHFDKSLITQVVINLLSNAIKFSEASGRISVECGEISENNTRHLKLCVHDHGIGIPKNELDSIFSSFIQSSKTMSSAGGTGLGLPICKEIIELHGGRIWAESLDEDGAKFTFVIPQKSKN